MAKKDHKDMDRNKYAFLHNFVKDIRRNKFAYIRSRKVADQVKKEDPNIMIEYDKEENLFIARYNYFE